MFVYYNPNPLGKSVGDCVIRAIAKATGQPWDDVYIQISLQGFKDKNMPSANTVWGNYLKSLGFKRHTIPNSCPDCYTVADFCAEHTTGTYILATGTHVIAVMDGNYYDAWDSGNEVPAYYFSEEYNK